MKHQTLLIIRAKLKLAIIIIIIVIVIVIIIIIIIIIIIFGYYSGAIVSGEILVSVWQGRVESLES